jgi:hypothetical protein
MAEQVDEVPTGNNAPAPVEFPLPSLRKFLLPDQLVLLRSFEAPTLPELDAQVNQWVTETMAIITIPSSINKIESASGTTYTVTLTHIRAADGIENVKA